MTGGAEPTSAAYEVSVSGVMMPWLRNAFADCRVTSQPTSTVFLLELDDDQGTEEIAELLRRKGLVLLEARRRSDRPE